MTTENVRTEIVKVGSDDIEAVRDEKGGGWVLVKRVCEVFGLKPDAQRKRLLRQAWATTSIKEVVAADGKKHEQFCLSVESTPMWLATLQTSRINPKIRPRLITFQKLAAKALADWAYGRNGSSFQADQINNGLFRLTEAITVLTSHVMSLRSGAARTLPARIEIDDESDLTKVSPKKIRKLLSKIVSRSTDHGFGQEFRSGWDKLYRMYGRECGLDLYETAYQMSQVQHKEIKPLDLAEKYGHLIQLYRFAMTNMAPGAPRERPVLDTDPDSGTTFVSAEDLKNIRDFDSFYE